MLRSPPQRTFTQIPTFTLLLIVFAEHPENTHKTKTPTINDDNERLQLC